MNQRTVVYFRFHRMRNSPMVSTAGPVRFIATLRTACEHIDSEYAY